MPTNKNKSGYRFRFRSKLEYAYEDIYCDLDPRLTCFNCHFKCDDCKISDSYCLCKVVTAEFDKCKNCSSVL